MSQPKPKFAVGATVTCQWDKGKITVHKIKAIQERAVSQSSIMYQVDPAPRLCGKDDWLDEAWFH